MWLTVREALQLGHNYIGTEHLLLGLLDEDEGRGGKVNTHLGSTKDGVIEWLIPVLDRLLQEKTRARHRAALRRPAPGLLT